MTRIAGKPILEYTIAELQRCGLRDIIIVLGPKEAGHHDIATYFSQGQHRGLSLRYVYEKEQLGMGKAIQTAAPLITRPFLVLNPNQINAAEFIPPMLALFQQGVGGVMLTKETSTPELYGIAVIQNGKVEKIVEKPERSAAPATNKIVGMYLLDPQFLSYLDKVPVQQTQFEIALDTYLAHKPLLAHQTTATTFTLKHPWHLFDMKDYLLAGLSRSLSPQASIHPSAIIEGNVTIEHHAKVGEYAIIKGPAYIGPHTTIGSHTLFRSGSCLEERASMGCYTEVKNALIGSGSSLHSGFVGDSLIGNNCHIGAGFITANKRIDRTSIQTIVKGKKEDTERDSLGIMMGNNCRVGIKASSMPGIIISPESTISPGSIIKKNC
jgi:NDP-sugar pyrophosphorylase family protein